MIPSGNIPFVTVARPWKHDRDFVHTCSHTQNKTTAGVALLYHGIVCVKSIIACVKQHGAFQCVLPVVIELAPLGMSFHYRCELHVHYTVLYTAVALSIMRNGANICSCVCYSLPADSCHARDIASHIVSLCACMLHYAAKLGLSLM